MFVFVSNLKTKYLEVVVLLARCANSRWKQEQNEPMTYIISVIPGLKNTRDYKNNRTCVIFAHSVQLPS
jgi:hypothetical protein